MQITAPCKLVAKVGMAIQHTDLTWCQPHHAAEHVSSGALALLSRLPLVCALDQLIHQAKWFQVVRWQLRHVQKVCVWEGGMALHIVAISLVMVKAMAEKVPMIAMVLLMMSFFAFSVPALMSFTS